MVAKGIKSNSITEAFSVYPPGPNKLVRSSKSLEKNQRLKVIFSNNDFIDVDINKEKI